MGAIGRLGIMYRPFENYFEFSLPLPSPLSLTKEVGKRPHYAELLEHDLISKYEKEAVDIGEWFQEQCRTHGNP